MVNKVTMKPAKKAARKSKANPPQLLNSDINLDHENLSTAAAVPVLVPPIQLDSRPRKRRKIASEPTRDLSFCMGCSQYDRFVAFADCNKLTYRLAVVRLLDIADTCGGETHHAAQDTEDLNPREAAVQDRRIWEGKTLHPREQYADTAMTQVQIKPRRLREALEIPFWRMIEKKGRVLDDSTQKEWLDDAEQRLRGVISHIDPIPVISGYVVERDADGLTIRTVTGLNVSKHTIGQLSSGEWPCWNEIIEAVPEFDMTSVVFDAVSRREWSRRWDMRIQQHRIQLEYGIFA